MSLEFTSIVSGRDKVRIEVKNNTLTAIPTYNIRYYITDEGAEYSALISINDNMGGEGVYHIISGLLPDKSYTITITANGIDGIGELTGTFDTHEIFNINTGVLVGMYDSQYTIDDLQI